MTFVLFSKWRLPALSMIIFMEISCAPAYYVPGSLDLSMVRVGQQRALIESALKVQSKSSHQNGRTLVLYDYGPDVSGARRAAEASAFCYPSIGGMLACSLQRAHQGSLAEASAAKLQGSLLQVIYNDDGHAEWVVFGSTAVELAKANEIIDAAERGEAKAALQVGLSFSEGANGFPVDSGNAYKWLSIARNRGAEGALKEHERVGVRLSPEQREAIDQEIQNIE